MEKQEDKRKTNPLSLLLGLGLSLFSFFPPPPIPTLISIYNRLDFFLKINLSFVVTLVKNNTTELAKAGFLLHPKS